MQNCPEETPGVFAWLFCFRKERWIMYDVLVIGGGVIGCAIARELSRRSGRVCVVERN